MVIRLFTAIIFKIFILALYCIPVTASIQDKRLNLSNVSVCDPTISDKHIENLDSLYKLLDKNNQSLKSSLQLYQSAVLSHKAILSSIWPTLSIQADVQPYYLSKTNEVFFNPDISSIDNSSNNFNFAYLPLLEASISMNILDLPRKFRINSSAISVNAALFGHKANIRLQQKQLLDAYVRYQGYKTQSIKLRSLLDEFTNFNKKYVKLYDAGFATEQQLLQQQTGYLQSRSLFIDTEIQLNSATSAIQSLIGVDPTALIQDNPLLSPTCLPISINAENIASDIREYYTPLQQIYSQFLALKQKSSEELARSLPVLSVGMTALFTYQYGNISGESQNNEYFNQFDLFPFLSFRMRINTNGEERKIAQSIDLQAKSILSNYDNILMQETALVFGKLNELNLNVASYNQELIGSELNTKKLNNEIKLQATGFSPFSDFITAQRDLFSSNTKLYLSQIQYTLNLIDIQYRTYQSLEPEYVLGTKK
jgi:outer membrane protein TolC